jgi:hypothetical protein
MKDALLKNLSRSTGGSNKPPVMSTTTFFLSRRHDARHTLPMPFFTIQISHISMNLISSCQEFIKEDSGAPKKRMSSKLGERDDFSSLNGKCPQG